METVWEIIVTTKEWKPVWQKSHKYRMETVWQKSHEYRMETVWQKRNETSLMEENQILKKKSSFMEKTNIYIRPTKVERKTIWQSRILKFLKETYHMEKLSGILEGKLSDKKELYSKKKQVWWWRAKNTKKKPVWWTSEIQRKFLFWRLKSKPYL